MNPKTSGPPDDLTRDEDDSGDDATRIRRRKWALRAGKTLIAVGVAAALIVAARTSLRQWREGTARLRADAARLERERVRASDPAVRTALARRRDELIASLPVPANLDWNAIAAASVLYGLGLVPPALLLRRAARSFGQPCRVSTAVAAQLLGHVGKYVPGKAMVVVLRVGALSSDGVGRVPGTVSVFMETLLMMAVGAAVGGGVIAWLPVPLWMLTAAVAVAIVAALPTLPPILRRAARFVTKVEPETSMRSGWAVFLAGWSYSLVSWALIGAAFMLLLRAIPSPDPLPAPVSLYPVAVAAISLAMVAGFASLLPGGAGVRELVLTAVLAPAVGVGHGLLAAIAARLMFMAVEVILAGGAWCWLRHRGTRGMPRRPGLL